MSKSLHNFQKNIHQQFPYLENAKSLVACSGGVDSMVLANLLLKCNLDFALAHCNYQLRGKASDEDAALVQDWGRSNNILVFIKTFDLSQSSGSIQTKARALRYEWFSKLLVEGGFNYLLTAHHADDNMETFFINLLRGTGLDGLTGIPSVNQKIIRPFLPFTKHEIVDYAKNNQLLWREDASNGEAKYMRNNLRLEVLPKLCEINTHFPDNFQKTQRFLSISSQLLIAYSKKLKNELFIDAKSEIHVAISELKKLAPLAGHLYLLFNTYGFSQWEDIQHLLDAQSGKEIVSKTHRLIKNREHLILVKLSKSKIDNAFQISEGMFEIKVPVHLVIEPVSQAVVTSENIVYIDNEKLSYPLELRKWKIGDYFYPVGMEGGKKVSKFFKDEKFSLTEKENQWLLCSDNDIVWILGKRLDDRFKVTQATTTMIKLTWII